MAGSYYDCIMIPFPLTKIKQNGGRKQQQPALEPFRHRWRAMDLESKFTLLLDST